MNILISTTDKDAFDKLSKDIPNNVKINYLKSPNNESILATDGYIHIVIQVLAPVIQGVIAAWIYDKIKKINGDKKINGIPINDKREEEIENILNDNQLIDSAYDEF